MAVKTKIVKTKISRFMVLTTFLQNIPAHPPHLPPLPSLNTHTQTTYRGDIECPNGVLGQVLYVL